MLERSDVWRWAFASISTGDRPPDLAGYEVSAREDIVGKVEAVVDSDNGRSCLVVKLRDSTAGKKRTVPVGVVDSIDHPNRRIIVRLTRGEIARAPDYHAGVFDDDDIRTRHEDYYLPYLRPRP